MERLYPAFFAGEISRPTDHEFVVAHSYAYGGSAKQDMGYYPFGKVFFSNLTHYVRSGDFVARLIRDARTLDEYAFAIGALSHYLGDSIGHSEAMNPATAMEFPKLKAKYGDSVTYGESPHSHIRTEFAFDVGELPTALSHLRRTWSVWDSECQETSCAILSLLPMESTSVKCWAERDRT